MKGTIRDEGAAGGLPVLEARQLVWALGAHRVVDDVSFGIRRGEVVGLIGPNGAGKSTLFSLLAGERYPLSGEIRLNGHTVTSEPAESRPERGMGRTFQVPRPFAALSVLENVMLGARGHRGERLVEGLLRPAAVRRAEQRVRDEAMQWLEFTTLAPLAREPARVLSIGQRKLLELARLLIAAPSVILLDEPMAGVQPRLIELLSERLRSLAQAGMTVLLVEHQLSLIAALCDRVLVMAEGKLLLSGEPEAVLADPRVAEAYLGMAAT